MPRRKWINKKTATHFTLVHRPQNDPLIHDDSAPSMVLNPTLLPNGSKAMRLDDLASELGSEAQSIRDNEGEAANYGIYYDDTEYDYMQHLRELGSDGGEVVFVESNATHDSEKGKGKQKQSLDDALRQLDLQDRSSGLLDDDILPSKNLRRLTYQSQQDVPDAIAGFQPDMDPRLREVLEALEDDAYVDDNDDVFQELARDAQELDAREFDQTPAGDEDDGWESDDTAKPAKESDEDEIPELVRTSEQPAEGPPQQWLEDFKNFKRDQQGDKRPTPDVAGQSEVQSSIWTTTTNGGRRKKRKGALTSQTGYSMTSSSLVRTEQLTILDARFDKIEKDYNQDIDDVGSISGISSASSVRGPVRSDFDGIMDEFLESYSMHGKKTVKKGKWGRGIEQLEEIRRELGPARIKS